MRLAAGTGFAASCLIAVIAGCCGLQHSSVHVPKYPRSIVIPCYQAQGFIADAVQCALTQAYPNVEVIVAPDDGNSYAFLRKRFSSPALKILPSYEKVQSGAGYKKRSNPIPINLASMFL